MDGSETIAKSLMQNRTTVEHVVDLLRREIITGRAKPGQRLVERELTERLGVSRTPVREALRRLVGMQLAVNMPYRGVIVRQLSLDFARNVYDIRCGLEGIAAYLAAERATDEERQSLHAHFLSIDELTRAGQKDEVMLLNNEFHRLIAAATHNELLRERVSEVWTSVNLVRAAAWEDNLRYEDSRDEHGAILAGILEADPEAARQACERHVRRSWRVVEIALQAQLSDQEEAAAAPTIKPRRS